MYSDNDIRLYHSFKGTTWKNHKYISKSTVGGKTRYKYSIEDAGDAIKDWAGYDEKQDLKEKKESADLADKYEKHAMDWWSEEVEKGYRGEGDPKYEDYALDYVIEMRGEQAAAHEEYRKALSKYNDTPLGRAENAIKAGREVLNDIGWTIEKGARAVGNAAKSVGKAVDDAAWEVGYQARRLGRKLKGN